MRTPAEQIDYIDKVNVEERPDLQDYEKIGEVDMNMIKNVQIQNAGLLNNTFAVDKYTLTDEVTPIIGGLLYTDYVVVDLTLTEIVLNVSSMIVAAGVTIDIHANGSSMFIAPPIIPVGQSIISVPLTNLAVTALVSGVKLEFYATSADFTGVLGLKAKFLGSLTVAPI